MGERSFAVAMAMPAFAQTTLCCSWLPLLFKIAVNIAADESTVSPPEMVEA